MKIRIMLGWLAVILSTFLSGFWAFWGTIENFRAGWHSPSLLENLMGLCIQYLSFMLLSIIISLIAIRWGRLGGILYIAMGGLFTYWILSGLEVFHLEIILSWRPVTAYLLLIALFYYVGRPEPRKIAYTIAVGIPLAICIALSIEPIHRISSRYYDGNFDRRVIQGNGVTLVWAPRGAGWNKSVTSWDDAKKRCQYLHADGKTMSDTPQNIWRLPTIDELVRSLTRGGKNCGGMWDESTGKATYQVQPDKESPLWNPYSPIIYWWTSQEKDNDHAYTVVYYGKVVPKPKKGANSTGFRAVKSVDK